MGKKIDTFVLGLCAAAGFYFFYQRAFRNRAFAILLALVSFIVLRKTITMLAGFCARFGWVHRRRLRSNAGSVILSLASMPEEEAHKRISALIRSCYGAEEALALVQNHPALQLSRQKIFEIWKQHRGKERVIICATCRSDADSRAMAASLKAPKLALVDADALSAMIAEHPEGFDFASRSSARLRFRFSHLRDLFLNRKNAPRCLLVSLSMLAVFLVSAKPVYLACFLLLLLLTLASFRRRPRPAKLF